MQEKYGFVYIWRDRKHKRYYIGSHWGFEDDGYICSSKWMRKAYKRRPKDFKRRILSRIYNTRNNLYDNERYYLNMIKENELGLKYYNRTKNVFHWTEKDEYNRKLIIEKIKFKLKGREAWNKGIPRSEEQNKVFSEMMRGKVPWNKGKSGIYNDEYRKKISEALRNRIHTEESKLKRSVSMIGKNKGKKMSQESIDKMAATKKGIKQSKETNLKRSISLTKPIPEDFIINIHMKIKDLTALYSVDRKLIFKWKKQVKSL